MLVHSPFFPKTYKMCCVIQTKWIKKQLKAKEYEMISLWSNDYITEGPELFNQNFEKDYLC